MRWKQRRPSGTWAMPRPAIFCGGTVPIARPSKRIEPALGGVRPEIARSVVDLPAPFVPIRVTISPSSTVRLIPASASIEP